VQEHVNRYLFASKYVAGKIVSIRRDVRIDRSPWNTPPQNDALKQAANLVDV
jgi:hypothetical protein